MKKSDGRAKRGRPIKRKTAPPPSPKGDAAVLNAIGRPDALAGAGYQGPEVPPSVDLPPPGAAEVAAAARLECEAAPEKKTAPAQAGQLPDGAEVFLEPGIIRGWLSAVNDRLIERRSLWAASKKEAQEIGAALEKVLDKWFPAVGSWGPEATLGFLMFIYLTPRVPSYIRSKRAAVAAPSAGASSVPDAPPPIGDSRLAS